MGVVVVVLVRNFVGIFFMASLITRVVGILDTFHLGIATCFVQIVLGLLDIFVLDIAR